MARERITRRARSAIELKKLKSPPVGATTGPSVRRKPAKPLAKASNLSAQSKINVDCSPPAGVSQSTRQMVPCLRPRKGGPLIGPAALTVTLASASALAVCTLS